MAAVIVKQKDVERLGKELLNEMFKFLHDEYILTEFEEMKKVKKEFLNNIILNHINTLHRNFSITDEKRKELVDSLFDKEKKEFLNNIILNHINTLHRNFSITDEKRKELVDTLIDKEKSIPNELELKVNAMREDGIDTEGIYQTLNTLKLDMEIDEDLYFKTKAFLDIHRVFESAYTYLE